MPDTFLSDRQVGERYNVHHLTPRRWAREVPTFPQPVKLSPGCTRWRLSDLEAWEKSQSDNAA